MDTDGQLFMLSTLGIEPCVLREDGFCESRLGECQIPWCPRWAQGRDYLLVSPHPPHFIVLSPGPALQPEDCRGADKVENKGLVTGAKCFVLSHVHCFLLSDKNIAF